VAVVVTGATAGPVFSTGTVFSTVVSTVFSTVTVRGGGGAACSSPPPPMLPRSKPISSPTSSPTASAISTAHTVPGFLPLVLTLVVPTVVSFHPCHSLSLGTLAHPKTIFPTQALAEGVSLPPMHSTPPSLFVLLQDLLGHKSYGNEFPESTPARTSGEWGMLVCLFSLRGRIWTQPQRDVRGLHRLFDYFHELGVERLKIRLVS
jgi:hypothetical protein